MTEQQWEKKLRIRTVGREANHADRDHHPYEPTPYPVLERLAASGYLTQSSSLIDYGCGKGRAAITLAALTGCTATGVEYNEPLWRDAVHNAESCPVSARVRMVCADAERFEVGCADAFYFFNPFSVTLLRGVLGRILDAFYADIRPFRLFFYYPDDEYRTVLLTHPELTLLDTLDCCDLFDGFNPREQILVMGLGTR